MRNIHSIVFAVTLAFGSPLPAGAVTMEERVAAALASNNSGTIRVKLGLMPEGTPGRDKVRAHLASVEKQEAIAAKKQAASESASKRKNGIAARKAYAGVLREKFLDNGSDIKVSVTGAQATQLNLKYALFGDVWVHKFRKGSLSTEISGLGFEKVDFNNGYDYHVVLSYK